MSIDVVLYYGHYFLIKEITVNHTKEIDGCPKCFKELSTKCCPDCGEECFEFEIVEQYPADLYDILDELGNDHLGKTYRGFITETDFTSNGRMVCILNETNLYKGRGGRLSDYEFFLPEMETPELNTTGQYRLHEFLKAYRERYGEDSIDVGIGLLKYTW